MIRFIIVVAVLLILVVWFTRAPKRSGLENGTRITLTTGNTGGQNRLPIRIMVLGNIDDNDFPTLKSLGSNETFTIEMENE